MKGLACAECFDIRALPRGDLVPVSCQCGNVTGWWLNGRAGIARYTAQRPAYAWGLGFNNSFLIELFNGYGEVPAEADIRAMHDRATNAPGYFFDKGRYGCWAIPFKPGRVRDVEWATNEERAAIGMTPYPERHALAPKPAGSDDVD